MAENNTTCSQKVSAIISIGLEELFYKHGKLVARNPYKTILLAWIVSGICGLGLLNFYEEKNMVNLWIPGNNDFALNHKWLMKNFPPKLRFQSLILVDEVNVLRPEAIKYMYKIHNEVQNIKTKNGYTLTQKCVKLPILEVNQYSLRRKRETIDDEDWVKSMDEDFEDFHNEENGVGQELDPSIFFYPEPYCGIVNKMHTSCFETSLLELFGYNVKDDFLQTLSASDLIDIVNSKNTSEVFKSERNYTALLGGTQFNSTGHLIGAKATYMAWFTESSDLTTEKDTDRQLGLDDYADSATLEFELELRDVLENQSDLPPGLKSYANVQRSYGDISTKAIWDDVTYMIFGYSVLYIFVQIMMGRFNRVEQRGLLGFLALSTLPLAIIASFGLCSLLGLSYGPMHTMLGCLLVGLGVDDAFVIVQEFNNAEENDKKNGIHNRTLEERIGRGMKQAGAGITVTSMTDIIVFAIGGTTVLPSLKSYSLYAAMGILFTYLFQITYFVACLTLDTKRIDEKRDGMFCWIKHKNFKPNSFSQRNWMQEYFEKFGNFLKLRISKVMVIGISLVITAFGIWGNVKVEIAFDYVKFLPESSNLAQWYQIHQNYFPLDGYRGEIYVANSNLKGHLSKIKKVSEIFAQNGSKYLHEFDSWYPGFENYMIQNYVKSFEQIEALDQEIFDEKLTQYLYSPSGGKYRKLFQFENKTSLQCGQVAPKVVMSAIRYQHQQFFTVHDRIEAMTWVKDTIKSIDFEGKAFAMSQPYSRWEVDEIIGQELYRNLLIAIICVLIVTLVFIADFRACMFVFLCVVLNLVNVIGYMHFWGLTIDIVVSSNILISVGLCVDFSAHVAHAFMHQRGGNADDRMVSTLKSIGPAVLNGGISTLLAVSMLANSESHVFISYFKIFFLMIVFGLYFGLVLLPVLLSLFGAEPNPKGNIDEDEMQAGNVELDKEAMKSLVKDTNELNSIS